MPRWFRRLCAGLVIPAMLLSFGNVPVSTQSAAPFAAEAADSVLIGEPSNNLSKHTYNPWASVIRSYLHEISDGTLERVEAFDGRVVIERYAAGSANPFDCREITSPLSLFGGAFFGTQYNFLVFGEKNENDDPDAEVVRVQKYTKDWTLLDSASLYGANTNEPFHFGSLRMEEFAGKLFVHTSHLMFPAEDGRYHQANMSFLLDIASMQVEQSVSGISLIQHTGYISHSFNQFARSDGTYLFRVDHGDSRPRAITLVRTDCGGSITNVSYCLPIPLAGENGDNYTDASVGGFELTDFSCLIAGNYVRPDTEHVANTSAQRNIFVSVTAKNLGSTAVNWITQYQPDDQVTPGTPYLVKLGSSRFLLMWEEYLRETSEYRTRMMLIGDAGTALSPAYTAPYRLSDCEPCLCSDGMIRWYVTNNSTPVFYAVDPQHLSDITANAEEGFDWDFDSTTGVLTVRAMPGLKPAAYPWSEIGNVQSLVIEEGVGTIPDEAFKNMRFTSVQLPDSLRSIGNSVFENCGGIKELILPPRVAIIGESAFSQCNNLERLELSPALTIVPKYLIFACRKLKEVTIPEGVTELSLDAFSYCTSLERIYLPASLRTITWNAFNECQALTDIYYGGTQEQWNSVNIQSENEPIVNATLHPLAQGLPATEPETEPTTGTTQPITYDTTEPFTDATESALLPTVDTWSNLFCISLDTKELAPEDFIRSAVIDHEDADLTRFSLGRTVNGSEEGLSPASLFRPDEMTDGIQQVTLYLYYDGIRVPLEEDLSVLIGVKGDANADGEIDATDASAILVYAAQIGAGQSALLTDGGSKVAEQFRLYMADINYDPEVGLHPDAADAASILFYAAQLGAGSIGTW